MVKSTPFLVSWFLVSSDWPAKAAGPSVWYLPFIITMVVSAPVLATEWLYRAI